MPSDLSEADVPVDSIWRSKSGRRWRAGRRWFGGRVLMRPLGDDAYGNGGGVKVRAVDPVGMEKRGWRRVDG